MTRNLGGAFDTNIIPELTALAENSEDFSGADGGINGGQPLNGSGWTMGAMFAHTSGLPLKISIGSNNMESQSTFFPGIVTLGDLLEDEGYRNVLLIGSDAEFGGRALYFKEHGNYTLMDYNYAKNEGWIPRDYSVWWGYEDKKLFEFAKTQLSALAAEDQPFCLTMLTVDTHFEDGYLCEDCVDADGDRYAAVIRCSDHRVSEFVRWVKDQDFYENTSIVIVGDHLTMDKDFCNNVPPDYERKVYTAYVNSAAVNVNAGLRREYSTFDLFPTTLAAMGCSIPGDRLGLGTNLFSGTQTILEQYGADEVNSQLEMDSTFMKSLQTYDYQNLADSLVPEVEWSKGDRRNEIDVSIQFDSEEGDKLSLLLQRKNGQLETMECKEIEDGTFKFGVDRSKYSKVAGAKVCFSESDQWVDLHIGEINLELDCEKSFLKYLDKIEKLDNYYVFASICDEGTASLDEEMMSKLHSIGVQADLNEKTRWGFAFLGLNGQSIQEELALDGCCIEGDLNNGVGYTIMSYGYESGNKSSIIIDGQEYSMNKRGLNFVVYDPVNNCVVSRNTFDTHSGEGIE